MSKKSGTSKSGQSSALSKSNANLSKSGSALSKSGSKKASGKGSTGKASGSKKATKKRKAADGEFDFEAFLEAEPAYARQYAKLAKADALERACFHDHCEIAAEELRLMRWSRAQKEALRGDYPISRGKEMGLSKVFDALARARSATEYPQSYDEKGNPRRNAARGKHAPSTSVSVTESAAGSDEEAGSDAEEAASEEEEDE